MYTRVQRNLIHSAAIIVAAVAMMASCSDQHAHATSIFGAPPAPYVAPYMPLGDCVVPYRLAAGQTKQMRCALASPAGLDMARVAVMATVQSGTLEVSNWIVFAGEVGPPSETIVVDFAVHNTGVSFVSNEATVFAAVAQTLTPAVAAAGVN